MKKLFYFAAFAACVLTSCQQVLDIQEKEEDLKTPGLVFTATTWSITMASTFSGGVAQRASKNKNLSSQISRGI